MFWESQIVKYNANFSHFAFFVVVLFLFCNSKGTVMQIEKILINDGLHVSKLS